MDERPSSSTSNTGRNGQRSEISATRTRSDSQLGRAALLGLRRTEDVARNQRCSAHVGAGAWLACTKAATDKPPTKVSVLKLSAAGRWRSRVTCTRSSAMVQHEKVQPNVILPCRCQPHNQPPQALHPAFAHASYLRLSSLLQHFFFVVLTSTRPALVQVLLSTCVPHYWEQAVISASHPSCSKLARLGST